MRATDAAAHPAGAAARPGGTPGYWRVLPGVFLGLLCGSVALWALAVVLSLTRVVNVSFVADGIYLPWREPGVWPVAASLAWGVLVSALVGRTIQTALARRLGVALAGGWCALAVAIGGYGSLLTARTTGVELFLVAFATPGLVAALAFTRTGAPRSFPGGRLLRGPRLAAVIAAVAGVGVLPYGALHPFVANGSGGNRAPIASDGASEQFRAAAGQPVDLEAGIEGGRLPITITGVRVLGSARGVRIARVALAVGEPVPPAGRLPLRLPAGKMLWISYAASLTTCTTASVEAARIDYRIAGVGLTETVPLQRRETLVCGQ